MLHSALDHERSDSGPDSSGGAEQMSDHGFRRADGEFFRVPAKEAFDGCGLDAVIGRCGCTVRIDVIELRRRQNQYDGRLRGVQYRTTEVPDIQPIMATRRRILRDLQLRFRMSMRTQQSHRSTDERRLQFCDGFQYRTRKLGQPQIGRIEFCGGRKLSGCDGQGQLGCRSHIG